MQSKTSFFNKRIFWNNMARFWPVWGSYFVILAFAYPVAMLSNLRWTEFTAFTALKTSYNLLKSTIQFGTAMGLVFGALSAMAVYSYLYTARSAGAMACLPIRREGMFITSFLSGIFGLLASNLAVFLLLAAVEASYGILDMALLLQWLAMISMPLFFFYSFASLCAVLTGHILVLPIVYAVLNFAAVVVEYIVKSLLEKFVYGLSTVSGSLWEAFSPAVRLWNESVYAENIVTGMTGRSVSYYQSSAAETGISPGDLVIRFDGWNSLFIYTAAAVVIFGLALFIYRKRRMETASDVVAVRVLKPVFKYCLAFGCAIVIGAVLFDLIFSGNTSLNPAIGTALCILFGAFVGYFAAEMLMRKSFRVFGTWKGFAAFGAALILLITAGETDLFGYERHVPDAAEVESVSLHCQGEAASLEEQENLLDTLALHRNIIANKAQYESNQEGENISLTLMYFLKSGGIMRREYTIPVSEALNSDKTSDLSAVTAIMNSDEAVSERKTTSIAISEETIYNATVDWWDGTERRSIQLSAEDALGLYETCIIPDIDSGALGRVWFYLGADYNNTVYDASISFDLVEKTGEKKDDYTGDSFYTTPTVNSAKTNEALKALGVELHTVGESGRYYGNEKYAYATATNIG